MIEAAIAMTHSVIRRVVVKLIGERCLLFDAVEIKRNTSKQYAMGYAINVYFRDVMSARYCQIDQFSLAFLFSGCSMGLRYFLCLSAKVNSRCH